MIWLHWTLMFVGGLVAWLCVGMLVTGLLRWLAANGTTDPDTCRDKAISMAGDAYREREG